MSSRPAIRFSCSALSSRNANSDNSPSFYMKHFQDVHKRDLLFTDFPRFPQKPQRSFHFRQRSFSRATLCNKADSGDELEFSGNHLAHSAHLGEKIAQQNQSFAAKEFVR